METGKGLNERRGSSAGGSHVAVLSAADRRMNQGDIQQNTLDRKKMSLN